MSMLPEIPETGMPTPKTIIMTGAASGTGAGVTKAFLNRGYNVFANSLDLANSVLTPAKELALVCGNIGKNSAAATVAKWQSGVRLNRCCRQQRRHLLREAIYGIHRAQFRAVLGNRPRGLHLHHPTRSEADADTRESGNRHLHHFGHGGASHGGCESVAADDHEGRPGGNHAQSGDGVCEGGHPLQRCRFGRCRYATDAKHSQETQKR
jgi:hypothetical protein